jgi:hypothetical protein
LPAGLAGFVQGTERGNGDSVQQRGLSQGSEEEEQATADADCLRVLPDSFKGHRQATAILFSSEL